MGVGDRWPAGCTTTSRLFAPSSWCRDQQRRPRDPPGRLNEDGTAAGLPIPGLASWLSDPSTGRSTVVGLDTVPADQRPTIRQTNTVHLAWDVMVGLGTLLFLLLGVVRRQLDLPAPDAGEQVVPAGRGLCRGPGGDHHGGRLGDRGRRQPWIVYNHMKVEDAATGNTGVWITFLAVVVLRRRRHHPRSSSCEGRPALRRTEPQQA